ncbi:transcriptional regulator, GntR family [Ruaniaceae bacterium KH17]|nr:transcriptional regulator, GntR family [Ruaniaceae bacterium KH17]
MSTQITIDLGSAVPPFEQVRSQLASLITSGTLTPGTRLPTVRDLAADLGIAVGTVTRAYRELEQLGLVTSRRRVGTVVSDVVQIGSEPVRAAVDQLVRVARISGLPDDDVLALVQGALLATPEEDRSR